MDGEPQIPGVIPADTKAKVEVTRNAKGDPQWTVRVVDGVSEDEMDRLRQIAVAQHKALLDDLLG